MAKKAKPIALHLVEGNKSRLTKAEIEARQKAEEKMKVGSNKVKPPKWLSKEAKKEFKRISKELIEIDLITNLDVDLLATYCDAYIAYQECTDEIKRDGLTYEYTNKAGATNKVEHPLLTKKKQLFEQMRAVAAEFGLTPAARAKLAMPKEPEKEETPFDKLFANV